MPEQPAVVFLTNRLPDPLIDALSLAGWQVFEALAISEVLHLCEHQKIRAVLIAAGYSHPALQEQAASDHPSVEPWRISGRRVVGADTSFSEAGWSGTMMAHEAHQNS